MSRQRWLLLFFLAFFGYGSLWWLYPRLSPASTWNYQLDRPLALARGRAFAQQFGINTTDWFVKVRTNRVRSTLDYYLHQQPDAAVTQFFTPLATEVTFVTPGETERVEVKLSGQGRPYSFSRHSLNQRNQDEKPDEPHQPPLEKPADEALVEQALAKLLGDQTALFGATQTRTRDRDRVKHTRTAALASETRLKLLAEITTQNNEIREAVLSTDFTDAFQREAEFRPSLAWKVLDSLTAILIIPLVIFGLLIFFAGWGSGELLHRPALRCFGLVFIFMFWTNYFGTFADDLNLNVPIFNPIGLAITRFLLYFLIMLCLSLPLYFFWASGHFLLARQGRRRTTAFELLLQGKWNTRYLAEHAAAGILLGGVSATLPLLVRLLPPFQSARFSVRDVFMLFTAKLPALGALAEDHVYGVFLFFALGVPLLEMYVPRPLLSRGLILSLGTLWFAGTAFFGNSAPAALLVGVGLSVLYYTIYRQFDFLTVLIAALSGMGMLNALALRAQPQASLQSAGLTLFAGLVLALLITLVGAWRGRAVPQETFAPLLRAARGIERERLKADLAVARRAQQQMLPEAAPHLPGYDIAAICTPSKDVGGDLYDFIKLPDGRLGIVVADVSGKGVPAALYMTLTKGLLASVSEEQSDPGTILREINRHLYEACRKKVFVTLFLGVLDPETRLLTYARAGHNPTVWRRALRNATELLRPPGMGLGLNQGKMFNATLKVASLQLEAKDALFFYSDGITEAMNDQQEEYGEERLMALAAETDQLNAGSALSAIMADVKAFLGPIAPQDDQTLVVIKVN